jgi:LCP family protein required for cell wall assembly
MSDDAPRPGEPPKQYYVPDPAAASRPAAPPPPAPDPPGRASPPVPGSRPASRSAPTSPAARRDGGDGGRGGGFWSRALRPKWRWLYLYLPILLVMLIVGGALYLWSNWNGVERVDLGDALTPASGDVVNYLLVGSDSRAGIDASTPNAGAIGPDVQGKRADTIIVLRVSPDKAEMMSIPRDLWVTNAATGRKGKINGSYNQGPANLVRTVTSSLGIPINHYIEVDFVSFGGIVDAMGGITIDFPNPAYDRNSGLNIVTSGPVRLDGAGALAYVRSRHYTQVINGKPVPDPTADLGREARQQQFIRTVLSDVGSTRNPITLAQIVRAGTDGMKVDTTFGIGDAWSLARHLSGSQPATVVLPTKPAREGSADVLRLDQPEATAVLAQFGAPS